MQERRKKAWSDSEPINIDSMILTQFHLLKVLPVQHSQPALNNKTACFTTERKQFGYSLSFFKEINDDSYYFKTKTKSNFWCSVRIASREHKPKQNPIQILVCRVFFGFVLRVGVFLFPPAPNLVSHQKSTFPVCFLLKKKKNKTTQHTEHSIC